MAEQAKTVQESFENRQLSTAEALEELFREIRKNEQRKREQHEKGLDGLTYFIFRTLLDAGIKEPEQVSKQIKEAFLEYPHWLSSEKDLRELRKGITFAILKVEDDIGKVSVMVEDLLRLLEKAKRI